MKEWIAGRNPVYEVLRARRRHFFRLLINEVSNEKGRMEEILTLASDCGLKTQRIPKSHLDRIVENHHGIAIEASAYPYSTIADILEQAEIRHEPHFLLILDTLQDPQNFGTILRTAEACSIHGVILPLRRSAAVTPAVVQASSGASEHLMIAVSNLAQAIDTLKKANIWVAGLVHNPEAASIEEARLDGDLAIVVGSEGEGMRELTRRSCDFLFTLPMEGKIESLNASVAGSIAIYLAKQQRHQLNN
jgi:23S rRNA (guanosine2251-2'-O)-methyltransferase